MRTRSLKTRSLLLCLLLFLPGTAPVHGGGQAEPRLTEVQTLIQKQDYSAALMLLAAIQRENPNLRDETSRLVEQIMAVTRQYNAVLTELNAAVQAGDTARIQALIPELHRIDPNRAEGTGAAMVAGFLKLMNDAQALLENGKPMDALGKYMLALTDPRRAGFSLPQSQFESAGYGEILVGSVRSSLAAILSAAGQGIKEQPALSPVLPAVRSLLSQAPTADSAARFDAVTAPLLRAAAVEGAVRQGAAAILTVNRTIQVASDRGRDDPYLRYLLWLCLGREGRKEGIAYALHVLWMDSARAAAAAAGDSVTAAFDSARGKFSSGALVPADSELRLLPARSAVAVKAAALALAGFDISPAGGWTLPAADATEARALVGRALSAQEFAAEAAGYRQLIAWRKDLDSLPSAAATPPASLLAAQLSAESSQLVSARAALDARSADARAQEAAWADRSRRWAASTDVSGAAAGIARSSQALADLFGAFAASELQPRDLRYALRIAALSGSGFPSRLQGAAAQRARAEDLKDGTANGVAPAAGTITRKHPEQALPLLTAAAADLDSLIADITAQQQQLEAEKPYVKSSPGYTVLFQGTAQQPGLVSLLQGARSERERIDTLVASARKQEDSAALASREGDNDFALAQAALTRQDPDGASSALELATAAYLRSLADGYTDHAAARTTTEADALNARILNLQNSLSVASAQKQIVSINKLIVARDFLGASDALDAAVREWNQTQEGTYPPFDNLRLTIQAAVELSQGREISRLDPKADVVNAFIKNAQDNLAAGRLTDAMQNVRDALAVAPNYGAAKVLQLMIKKQTDPTGFERDATAQIATYLKMGADSANIDGQKTAYLALLDYSRLDPKFAAQTRGTIQELEYSLGLARRPPTARQVAQSNALVQQATLVQQQGTQDAYQQALTLLKQALQVNPDNTNAVRLDGLIRTRMGSTALSALSAADTQTYNQAFSLFLSGAYQDAYDKVLQIWNDPRTPRNKTYGPLQRLKKRLEVQLNIS